MLTTHAPIAVQASQDHPGHALVSIGTAISYVAAPEIPVLARALYRAAGLPFPGTSAVDKPADTTLAAEVLGELAGIVGRLSEDTYLGGEDALSIRLCDMLGHLASRLSDAARGGA